MSAPQLRILFIGTVFPEPTSSAAGVRTLSLLEDFLSRGDRVLFASPSNRNAFSDALRLRGIETVQIGPNDSAFDVMVREFSPHVVVFDRFMLEEQFGWRVAEHAPHAIRVLDTIDLHFLRRVRGEWLNAALKKSRSAEGGSIAGEDLAGLYYGLDGIETEDSLRELAAIYRSDLTLILSTFEEKLLADRFQVPGEILMGLGFAYPVPDALDWSSPFSERKHFVSIGNFRHAPNRDSAFWLAHVLWPAIRERLAAQGDVAAELHLYGAYPPKEITALDAPKCRIRVFGPAEDSIMTLRNYRALLAPIRFGAGIKGKIADAWAAGVPVVTTPIGAEGMSRHGGGTREGVTALNASHGGDSAGDGTRPAAFAGAVADTEESFVDRAAEIYLDAAASQAAVHAGRAALADLYGVEKNRARFLGRLAQLASPEALALHRARNFIGRMLRSEIAGRTKYLSKWIEEKNKVKPLQPSEGKVP